MFGAELDSIETDFYLLVVIKVQHVPTIRERERARAIHNRVSGGKSKCIGHVAG